jgi:hypothetical protein
MLCLATASNAIETVTAARRLSKGAESLMSTVRVSKPLCKCAYMYYVYSSKDRI